MDKERKSFSERLSAYTHTADFSVEPTISGQLVRVVGMTLEVVGLELPIGSRCLVINDQDAKVEAEVVGFAEQRLFLMPINAMVGLRPGLRVVPVAGEDTIAVGEQLLGRVIDGTGKPLDGLGPLNCQHRIAMRGETINPLHRRPIDRPMDVGIRAINSMLTVGRGQRLGLFAGSGVGKSVLLGMMT